MTAGLLVWLMLVWLMLAVVVLALFAGGRRGDSLFDRLPCPHCGMSTPRGTGCGTCGTWVGR